MICVELLTAHCRLRIVGYSAYRMWCAMVEKREYAEEKWRLVSQCSCHARRFLPGLLLIGFLLFVSCSAPTMPVSLVSPETAQRTEVLVVSTFTPVPTTQAMNLDMPETPSLQTTSVVTPTELEEVPTGEELLPMMEVTVAVGDTLIEFALTYDVPMAAIQLANNMGASTVVRVGQVLFIPAPESWAHAAPYWVVHVVEAGESISKIAAKYDLTIAKVIEANRFDEADYLTVGQQLIVPLEGPAKMAAASLPLATAVVPTMIPSPPTAQPVMQPTITLTPEPLDPTSTPMRTLDSPVEISSDTAALRMEVYRLINEQRAFHNLPPLVWNDILASAAQKHADDCYARGWCGHTGSDGSTMKTRIVREGYDPARWSECWAWYATPAKAVAMWMDEVPPNDPHRRTILSTYLTEVGVGVVPGTSHGYYFIADFGTPRE